MIERYHVPPPQKTAPGEWQSPVDSCEHSFELRRMTLSKNSIQFKRQCVLCGKGSNAIPHSALSQQDREQAPEYDRDLQDNVRHAAWQQRREATDQNFQLRWWAWYDGYLESPVWRRRRAAVIKRARGVCESCGSERAIIAHHLNYDHVGAEPLFDLVAVCSSCHEQLHPQEE